jgi:N-acetylmuramoyl-L-alanine amidase
MRRLALVVLATLLVPTVLMAQRTDLSGLTICIDPGHGGYDPADDRHIIPDPGIDFWESESNWQKALLLRTLLQEKGATVILTRGSNNVDPALSARVAYANANNADWFHSIHSNAANGRTNLTLMLVREQIVVGGDPIYGPGTGSPEWPQAWDISRLYLSPYLKAALRTSSYSTYLDWTFYGGANGGWTLGVLRGLTMPGQLSEGSMHDVYPETRRLMNNDYRKMEAYAIRNAFLQYFTVPSDGLGIIAGLQTDAAGGTPLNYASARLEPGGRTYAGDGYNNGFYMFDRLGAGTYTVYFETPGFRRDSVVVTLAAGATAFRDRALTIFAAPTVITTTPAAGSDSVAPHLPLTIAFTKPMNTGSVVSGFSIAPPAAGTFSWDGTHTILTFTPWPPLQADVEYIVTVAPSASAADGQQLDGNGDGIAGDPFLLQFRTVYVDVYPPALALASPDSGATILTSNPVLNFVFDEPLKVSSVSPANFVVQEVGASYQARAVDYSEGAGRGGVTVFLPYGLKPGTSYQVRIVGVADSKGNAVPPGAPIYRAFAVGPDSYTFASIDSLTGPLTAWTQPLNSPFTAGATAATFVASPDKRFPSYATSGTTAALTYAWNTGAPDHVIDLAFDTTRAPIVRPVPGTILQTFVHGDGGSARFRFVVEDSVGMGQPGGMGRVEVSPWQIVDWVGWRPVEWQLETVPPGAWTGDGALNGEIRFRGYHVGYEPGASAPSGTIRLARAQFADRTATGVADTGVPSTFGLSEPYPNPFNPSASMLLDLPARARIRMTVYDVVGREIAVIAEGEAGPGRLAVRWDGRDAGGRPAASGVYIVRATVSVQGTGGAATMVRKLLLTK